MTSNEPVDPRAGLRRLSFYVIFMHQTERWAQVPDEREAVLREHLRWQRDLEAAGTLVLAGPLDISQDEPWSGMAVVRADSRDAAMALAAREPFQMAGLRRNEVRHWQVNEGSITLTVRLLANTGDLV